jgi:hypothetical protein
MTKRTFRDISCSVSRFTRSKKPRLNVGLSYHNKKKHPWIPATKTYNYMNDDPLIDWLELTKFKNRKRSLSIDNSISGSFTEYIRSRGIEFEKQIVEYIDKNIHPVVKVDDFYSKSGVEQTKKLLKMGIPIIHSAPLCHEPSKTYGVADLIVRSDYLFKIAPNTLQDKSELEHGCRFSNDYHYVVIDIKFTTLNLNCEGKYLLNQGSIPAYKSQLWIYNRALGYIQKYNAKCSYILGRRWTYRSKNIKYCNEKCFDRLGIIEMNKYDHKIIEKAKKAVRWCRSVTQNGYKWTLNPPSRDELYPNMCKDNYKWNSTKQEISKNLGEITQIWMCGVKNRKKAFLKGIRDWKDSNASSESFGFSGSRGVIIDKMLNINKQNTKKILPETLSEMNMTWRDSNDEVFVDFETFNDLFTNDNDNVSIQSRGNLIYQIGVGFVEDNTWNYKYFICEKPTKDEEFKIMKEFIDFLNSKNISTAWYWHAETNFWKSSCNSQFNRDDISQEDRNEIITWDLSSTWKDLRKLFVKEHIVIKGCFSYGLKDIGKNMKLLNLITTPIESECSNGKTAMIQAWKCYQKFNNPLKCGAMKDVIQYNEYDCRLLCDIITYLRQNH